MPDYITDIEVLTAILRRLEPSADDLADAIYLAAEYDQGFPEALTYCDAVAFLLSDPNKEN